MKTIVNSGQSLFDKAIELTGSIENAFELAVLNGISVTESLTVGIKLQTTAVTNKTIYELFNEDNIPASAFTIYEINKQPIGFPYGFPIQF